MQYNRGPRVRNVPKNHALSRLQQKKLKNNDENYLLSFEHLKSCFKDLRTTAGHAAGPDGLKFDSLNETKWNTKLRWLSYTINARKYQLGPKRDVKIPKDDGSFRTIKISNIIDRVASRAALEAMSPILEPTFTDWSYGYRPNKSYQDMLISIKNDCQNGLRYILKADIVKAFDNVNIRKLRKLISELRLDSVLKDLVESIVSKGLSFESVEDKNLIGVSQGDSLSGLLFNFYVHECHDAAITKQLSTSFKIYRYADDIVICSSSLQELECLAAKSLNMLTLTGFTHKSVGPVDILNEKINILGLTLSNIENIISYSLCDLSWDKLISKLDECLTQPLPTANIKQVVKGWQETLKLVKWEAVDQYRLADILSSYGLDPKECSKQLTN